MALYETTFIVRQDVTTTEVEDITKSFSKIVDDNKGKVIKVEKWGLKTLAYKVNKNRKGHYVHLGIDAPSEVVTELTRQYKLNENVIRNLTIRVDEFSKEASPQMAKKGPTRNTSNKGDR